MKTAFIIILFPVFSLFQAKTINAQQAVDFAGIVAEMNPESHVHDFSGYFNECSNEAEVFMTGFLIGYKSFFSSQDARSCIFEPSCSVYALETIKRRGLIIGFFDAIDRLTRCNGLSPEDYEAVKGKQLLIDQP